MARESVEEKALRYIAEGRVNVVAVDQGRNTATVEVKGSHPSPYKVDFRGGEWTDNCDARVSRCAHVVAASMVVHLETDVRLYETSEDLDRLLSEP